MLDAYIRKGARRILERKSDEHKNNKTEDAITSMVFSPVQFMGADDVFACFAAFLPELKHLAEGLMIHSHQVKLWPRLPRTKSGWCEPDLLVKFDFHSSTSIVLIGEMKWDSAITAAQIERERAAALQEFCDARIIVFAITKNAPYPIIVRETN